MGAEYPQGSALCGPDTLWPSKLITVHTMPFLNMLGRWSGYCRNRDANPPTRHTLTITGWGSYLGWRCQR